MQTPFRALLAVAVLAALAMIPVAARAQEPPPEAKEKPPETVENPAPPAPRPADVKVNVHVGQGQGQAQIQVLNVDMGWGQEPAPVDAATVTDEEFHLDIDARTLQEIDGFIGQLGSPLYAERERAVAGLTEIGVFACGRLREAYRASDDLEVRLAIEELLRTIYLNYHLLDRNGFLGIKQNPIFYTSENDPRIEDGTVGIIIEGILPSTAAERHGLLQRDVIIALDGERLPPPPRLGDPAVFGEKVRLKGPGAMVKLTILRGPQTLDVEVRLGRRPEQYYNNDFELSRKMIEQRERFRVWWGKHVRASGAAEK